MLSRACSPEVGSGCRPTVTSALASMTRGRLASGWWGICCRRTKGSFWTANSTFGECSFCRPPMWLLTKLTSAWLAVLAATKKTSRRTWRNSHTRSTSARRFLEGGCVRLKGSRSKTHAPLQCAVLIFHNASRLPPQTFPSRKQRTDHGYIAARVPCHRAQWLGS